jgi:glucokinase
VDDPHEVSRRAASGECRFCQEALQRFSSFLGAAAGDLALMFCALGGVYISGGLAKRLGALFDVERFRASFVAKGRFVDYLAPIPTYLVTRRDPGLLGAAAYPLSA